MANPFRKVEWKSTIITSVMAGIIFSVFTALFVWDGTYVNSWLLYLGSFAFMVIIVLHTYADSKKRGHRESTVSLVFSSHIATIGGVALATALSFVILTVLVPGYLGGNTAARDMTDQPAQMLQGRTEGLSLSVFLASTVINFSCGSFVGIIFPFTMKRNQMKDAKDPAPLHNRNVD